MYGFGNAPSPEKPRRETEYEEVEEENEPIFLSDEEMDNNYGEDIDRVTNMINEYVNPEEIEYNGTFCLNTNGDIIMNENTGVEGEELSSSETTTISHERTEETVDTPTVQVPQEPLETEETLPSETAERETAPSPESIENKTPKTNTPSPPQESEIPEDTITLHVREVESKGTPEEPTRFDMLSQAINDTVHEHYTGDGGEEINGCIDKHIIGFWLFQDQIDHHLDTIHDEIMSWAQNPGGYGSEYGEPGKPFIHQENSRAMMNILRYTGFGEGGNLNNGVKRLQEWLANNHSYHGEIDGNMNIGTFEALTGYSSNMLSLKKELGSGPPDTPSGNSGGREKKPKKRVVAVTKESTEYHREEEGMKQTRHGGQSGYPVDPAFSILQGLVGALTPSMERKKIMDPYHYAEREEIPRKTQYSVIHRVQTRFYEIMDSNEQSSKYDNIDRELENA